MYLDSREAVRDGRTRHGNGEYREGGTGGHRRDRSSPMRSTEKGPRRSIVNGEGHRRGVTLEWYSGGSTI